VIYTQQLEDSVLVLHKQQQDISCKIYSIINSVIKTQCHVSVPSFPPLTGEDKIIGVSYEPTERHLTILFNNSKWFVFQLAGDFSAIELHSCLHLRNIRFTKPTAIVPLSPSYAAMIVRGSITVWNYENGTPFARRPKVFSVMPTTVNVGVTIILVHNHHTC
jgi:hypothetical protein